MNKLLEYFFEAYEERLGQLSSDQSLIRWLATHGKELTMARKDVLRYWHGTCNVDRNWDEQERNEANRRDARNFRSYFHASQRGSRRRFIKGGLVLTVVDREAVRGAARQNANHVEAAVGVPKNRDGMTVSVICEFCRCMALKVS